MCNKLVNRYLISEGNTIVIPTKKVYMNQHFILKQETGEQTQVFCRLDSPKIEEAKLEFTDFIIANMQNLGYTYHKEATDKTNFLGKGFYKKQDFIPWQMGMLKFTYASQTFSFQPKFNDYV